MKKFRIGATDIALLVISILFFVGMLLWFGPCNHVKDDGSFMNCHWAGVILTGLAAVVSVISLAHFFIPDERMKAGLSAALIPVGIFICIVPGNLISLCMMSEMRCRAVMTPAAIVCAILVIIASAADITVQLRRRSK